MLSLLLRRCRMCCLRSVAVIVVSKVNVGWEGEGRRRGLREQENLTFAFSLIIINLVIIASIVVG